VVLDPIVVNRDDIVQRTRCRLGHGGSFSAHLVAFSHLQVSQIRGRQPHLFVRKILYVIRVNDRRVLNGIFWVLRSGAPWRDVPDNFGPYTTCYNRFVRWRRAGVWAKIMSALAGAHDAAVQMIDTSIVRVHQHGACITRNRRQ